jgi:hypothetical protein
VTIAAVFAAHSALSQLAPGKDNPSLDETLSWIQSKISADANNTGACHPDEKYCLSYAAKDVHASDCAVTWTLETNQIGIIDNVNHTHFLKYYLPLLQSSTSVTSMRENSGWLVILSTPTSSIRLQDGSQAAEAYDAVHIKFANPSNDNQDLALRMERAFRHAIQLCQSKRPVSNEPF